MGVTIKQIAKMAGVSRGTVDRVIHNRYGVDAAVKEQVEQILKQVNYKPNAIAQALKRSERSLHFGLVIPDIRNLFWEDVLQGFQDAEKEYESHGVHLIQKNMRELSADEQLRCLQELLDEGVDGLLIPGMNSQIITDFVNRVPDRIPVITLNNDIPDSRRLCFVGQNLYEAGMAAGRLMAMITRKSGRIIAFAGRGKTLAHIERYEGFRKSLQELRPDLSLDGPTQHVETEEATYEIAKKLLAEDPSIVGIYVACEGGVGAAKALKESGRRPDVKMVCFDMLAGIRDAVKEDIIDVTIGQEPYLQGYLPVKLMYEYLTYGTVPPHKKLYTAIDIRVKENIDYMTLQGLSNFSNQI